MTRIEERVIRLRSLGDLSTLHGVFAEGATKGMFWMMFIVRKKRRWGCDVSGKMRMELFDVGFVCVFCAAVEFGRQWQ